MLTLLTLHNGVLLPSDNQRVDVRLTSLSPVVDCAKILANLNPNRLQNNLCVK